GPFRLQTSLPVRPQGHRISMRFDTVQVLSSEDPRMVAALLGRIEWMTVSEMLAPLDRKATTGDMPSQ
ncbi:hypothetical protein ACKI16_47755, partial [Streptomyces scabiei]|uniref:hypothetical protein n=1 Tax=Streptomyces scabiei TaxID=1930 RepID=UPI0038F60CCF